MTTETAVTEALAAEHAAIYAYGPVGALLTGARAELAREAEQAHRARRDQLLVLLAERGLAAPPAAPAYELPFQVADESDAMDLAMLVEERVSAVWRAALTDVDGTDRELVLTALVEAAVWATRWRLAAGVEPPTVAFAGETSPAKPDRRGPAGDAGAARGRRRRTTALDGRIPGMHTR